MPTASAFTFTFPWAEMVGGFNSFITMFSTPLAISVGLVLATLVVSLTIGLVKRARSNV